MIFLKSFIYLGGGLVVADVNLSEAVVQIDHDVVLT